MDKRRAAMAGGQVSRRDALAVLSTSGVLAACEAIGAKLHVTSTTTVGDKTTVRQYEVRNWGEFEKMMGEVATDFSSFAKELGATVAELGEKLVAVPPQGKVQLGHLDPELKPYEGDVRYDYLKVATMEADAEYDFKYVQIGIGAFDAFFKAAAEMYATAYQLIETGRHVHVASAKATGKEADAEVQAGDKRLPKADVERDLNELNASQQPEVKETASDLNIVWGSTAKLGTQLASKSAQTVQAGLALVASAPQHITNPKLLLHLDLIVKGLAQSVDLTKDTGEMLTSVVG